MRTEVAIVGGGLAGLETARRLHGKGVDVRLFEARPRLGGRILSAPPGGLDLGPAWFWPGQPRMTRLTAELGLPVFPQHGAGRLVFEDGAGAVRRDMDLDIHQGAQRVAGGLGALIDRLAAALPAERVLASHRVRAVAWTGGGVALEGAGLGGAFTVDADRVVLALPQRVLLRDIAIAPTLPAPLAGRLAATPTWMAGSAKLMAVYKTPFWRKAGLSGDAISHRGPLVQIHDASPQDARVGALFAFVGLPASARAEAGEAALKDHAVAQLTRLFGEAAGAPEDLILADWSSEPLTATEADTQGAPEHPRGHLGAALDNLEAQGLIFAGTELAPEHPGLLEGALASAARAVEQIVRSIAALRA